MIGTSDSKKQLDYKIFIIILSGVIVFQFFLNLSTNEDDTNNAVIIISIVSPLAVGLTSLTVSKRYWKSNVLGNSYLALAIAFLFVGAGEISYIILDFVYDVVPYPSFADIFFFLLYPFSMIHLVINIRFFAKKVSTFNKLGIIAIASILTLLYSYLAYDATQEFNFDFAYGIIFVGGSSAILATAIFGVQVTRKIPLGAAWLVLMIGIALGMGGDFWYHLLELEGTYTIEHVVNLTWYASYWIIVYALLKHRTII